MAAGRPNPIADKTIGDHKAVRSVGRPLQRSEYFVRADISCDQGFSGSNSADSLQKLAAGTSDPPAACGQVRPANCARCLATRCSPQSGSILSGAVVNRCKTGRIWPTNSTAVVIAGSALAHGAIQITGTVYSQIRINSTTSKPTAMMQSAPSEYCRRDRFE